MKKLFTLMLIFVSLLLVSCTQTVYIANKEFVIKQIDATKKKNSCEYVLYNAKNKKVVFEDNINKYHIGDTLILVRK